MSTKILDKVKKMLALANDAGATEGERDNAMRMAYNLLAKHNLTMQDLPTEENHETRQRESITISADKWARNIADSMSRLFFCVYYFQRTGTSGKDMHVFIGKVSNTVTAIGMTEYLIKSIKREATKRYKSPTSPEGRSFCVGAMNAIYHRVEAMLESDIESEPGTAVVLYSLRESEKTANEQYLANDGIELEVGKSRRDNSLRGSAYMSGSAYGKTVSLANQVGGSTATKSQKQLN